MSKKLSIWSSKVSFLNVEVYDMTLASGHIKLKLVLNWVSILLIKLSYLWEVIYPSCYSIGLNISRDFLFNYLKENDLQDRVKV